MENGKFHEFYREDRDLSEYTRVKEVAHSLISYIRTTEISEKIVAANRKGVTSSEIQNCILPQATQLGFHSEKQGLFSNHANAALRPDYYLNLSPGRGIILEVEKGKTLTNNMDVLDLWKCHICAHAQYLFLMVPEYAQNAGPRNVFDTVVRRMQPFFSSRGYIGVYGLFIFGY
jgi:hypothetical protein